MGMGIAGKECDANVDVCVTSRVKFTCCSRSTVYWPTFDVYYLEKLPTRVVNGMRGGGLLLGGRPTAKHPMKVQIANVLAHIKPLLS